jgi:glucan biosynthesis protein C
VRHPSLDAARAAAMLLGVFFHGAISFMATPLGWAVQDRSTHVGVDAFTWICHAFRMPVFFLLSGFFSRLIVEKRGVDAFFRQRLKRLALPFLLFWPPLGAALLFLWRWGRSLPGQPAMRGLALDVPTDRVVLSPAHLWFLYYLLMLAVVAAVLARWRAPAWIDRLRFATPVAVAGVLTAMPSLEISTPVTFLPKWPVLAFYGLFFFQGWLLHRQPERIPGYGRLLWLRGLAAVGLLAALAPLAERVRRAQADGDWAHRAQALGELHVLGALLLAAFSWVMVGLFLGLFVRFMRRERPWVAWLSDAAYWVYLAHLPVCVLLQVWLAPRDWPGAFKYALVCAGTLAFCLGSYALAVRRTWIGRLLNGPRPAASAAGLQ